jgi:hypothetical protein
VKTSFWSRNQGTNDEIDLLSEFEGEVFVTHELVHFNGLNDTVLSDSL